MRPDVRYIGLLVELVLASWCWSNFWSIFWRGGSHPEGHQSNNCGFDMSGKVKKIMV